MMKYFSAILIFFLLNPTFYTQDHSAISGYRGNINTIAFSPDGSTIAGGDENGNLIFTDLNSMTRVHSLETGSNITSINYSPASLNLIVYTTYEGEVNIIKASTKEVIRNFKKEGELYYSVFSPDGKQLAVAYTREPTEKEQNKGIRLNFIVELFETGKFEKIKTLRLSKPNDPDGEMFGAKLFESYRYNAFSCDFNSTASYLASGSMGKNIAIYSFEYKKFAPPYKGHSKRVTFVTFSADGNYLCSTSKDESAKIWNVTSGGSIITLKGHTGTINSASFSPESKYVATASNDETVKIWDVKTSALIKTLTGLNGEVITVKFSPDGTYLAAAGTNEKIMLWKIAEILPE
ncbi:MAG TPA: WD40 repeat domain-containing protein [Ignavibacteria bacterium]|nr:WD40 repeat domain-containing protein [Ignavibacteria bacterium]